MLIINTLCLSIVPQGGKGPGDKGTGGQGDKGTREQGVQGDNSLLGLGPFKRYVMEIPEISTPPLEALRNAVPLTPFRWTQYFQIIQPDSFRIVNLFTPGFHPDKISRAPRFSLSSLTRA